MVGDARPLEIAAFFVYSFCIIDNGETTWQAVDLLSILMN